MNLRLQWICLLLETLGVIVLYMLFVALLFSFLFSMQSSAVCVWPDLNVKKQEEEKSLASFEKKKSKRTVLLPTALSIYK